MEEFSGLKKRDCENIFLLLPLCRPGKYFRNNADFLFRDGSRPDARRTREGRQRCWGSELGSPTADLGRFLPLSAHAPPPRPRNLFRTVGQKASL